MGGVRDDLTKTNTVVHIIETRLTDNSNGLKQARACLEELDHAMQKLHEELEKTKGEVVDVQAGVKSASGHVKKVHEGLDRTVTSLQTTQTRLEAASGVLESTRQGLNQMRGNVQSLKEGHEMAHRTMANLKNELDNVGSTANAVKAGLKETNALVLPNLHMELGGSMTGTGMGMPSTPSRGTDRHIRKVAKGSTPNRMS